MPSDVQIYSPRTSAALDYVLNFIFDEFYGCGSLLISGQNQIRQGSTLINYSDQPIENSIQIIPTGYIFEKDLREFPKIIFGTWNEVPVFFETGADLPFDLFGAIFFLLSRAEEYANPKRDQHGRFRAEYSVFTEQLIGRPLIDEWLYAMKKQYLQLADLNFKSRDFRWVNTYDIDVAYAFKNRPFWRKAGASIKNLLSGDFRSFKKRFRVLLHGEHDPFDTYDFQEEVSRDYSNRTLYFFLLGNKGKHDHNLSPKNGGMQALMKRAVTFAEVGIHPSYASVDHPELLPKEINRLRSVIEKTVDKSRQHFLRFELPETFRHLLKNGIREDYSMGYADCPGFRSGTCTPHLFFDLVKNEATELKLFPLAVMDATLRDYRLLDFTIAAETLKWLVARVKAVDGTFISLWHNDTLQDRPDNFWRHLYLEMATYTRDL